MPPALTYCQRIQQIASAVPTTIVDFSIPRVRANSPTQVSSNFITNREQGDWAENLIVSAINSTARNYIAVKYGKSDDVIAGEAGFSEFYQEFQEELDTIGKRPDILIFKRTDYDTQLGPDISRLPHTSLTEYVKKACMGIEVRSSSFLSEKYDRFMSEKNGRLTTLAIELRDRILDEYMDLLDTTQRRKYIPVLEGLTAETLSVASFKVPGWSSSDRLVELNKQFKKLKTTLIELQKRDFLSITPKVEDIKVVYKWIETFNVPHYYFQVFFDKVYGIAFEEILNIISDSDNEEIKFFVEKDNKNQNKQTIKINPKNGLVIAGRVEEPQHESKRREMDRGRLLFYVTFRGGRAFLDISSICAILGINTTDL
jgi:hypothetical protein